MDVAQPQDARRAQLRRQMRQARRRLRTEERSTRALALARQVVDHPLFLRSRRIACYLAVRGEMDVTPLRERALAMGKDVYLPVLFPYRHNRLWFAPFRADAKLVENRFGIPEPNVRRSDLVNPMALDLVLVPVVAFDDQCNRLGMGGGYYDRSFSFLRFRRQWKKPHLLGVAYEFQRTERLARQPWDVPLTAVATDQGLHWPHEP